MFATVFPPVVDVLFAATALGIVSFWTGVAPITGGGRLVNRIASCPFDPTVPVGLASPSVSIGVLAEEVAS